MKRATLIQTLERHMKDYGLVFFGYLLGINVVNYFLPENLTLGIFDQFGPFVVFFVLALFSLPLIREHDENEQRKKEQEEWVKEQEKKI